MPLALAVVGILTEDQDLHLVVRRRVEGGEDLLARRIDGTLRPLLLDELGELLEVGLLELLAETPRQDAGSMAMSVTSTTSGVRSLLTTEPTGAH